MWINKTIFLIILLFVGATHAAEYKKVDSIVAIVDNDLVMRSELDAKIKQIKLQFRQKGARLPPKEALEKQVLDRLIMRRLQLNAAKRAGINVDEGMLARILGNIAQKNRMNIGQFRKALERAGISFKRYKNEMREQFLINRLHSRAVLSKIKVSKQEIDAFLSKEVKVGDADVSYRVGHILVALPEGAESEDLVKAKQKAMQLVKRLRAGADFRDVAAQYSDAGDALDGGDLGWRKRGALPSMFADEAPKLQKGQISNPIRSASGFHIIKMLDRKGLRNYVVNQAHVRQILIRTSENMSDAEAKRRLEQLRDRIVGGDKFSSLARAHSNDTASAVKGGDLGWLSPNDMLPTFRQELKTLNTGEVSRPFKSQLGWHLLEVIERRAYDSADDVKRNKARSAIKKRKGNEAVQQYVCRLHDEAYIEKRLNSAKYDL